MIELIVLSSWSCSPKYTWDILLRYAENDLSRLRDGEYFTRRYLNRGWLLAPRAEVRNFVKLIIGVSIPRSFQWWIKTVASSTALRSKSLKLRNSLLKSRTSNEHIEFSFNKFRTKCFDLSCELQRSTSKYEASVGLGMHIKLTVVLAKIMTELSVFVFCSSDYLFEGIKSTLGSLSFTT